MALVRRLILGIAIGVGVYAVGAVIVGVHELGRSLASFRWWLLVPVLLLTMANYVLRFAKWQAYLRTLQVSIPLWRNLLVFIAGLSMVVTPGKVGELLKSYLLSVTEGVPMARTAPVVVAERVTDLVALLLLMGAGVLTFRRGAAILAIVGGAVACVLVVTSSRRLSRAALDLACSLPGLKRIGEKLQAFHQSTVSLFRLRPLLVASSLSLAAWFCECLGAYLVMGGFPPAGPSVLMATFIYSATTLGGLPTPGGLGLTDGSMVSLLHVFAGAERGQAAAATLIVRLCTLWFAVLVGVGALLALRTTALSSGFMGPAELPPDPMDGIEG